MPQREQDFSDGCPTTYVALSSPTCTSPMYAQRWNTQAPYGMVPFVTKMRYNSRESKQQSLAESCMPHGTLRNDNFLKNSTGLLFDGVEKQPTSASSIDCCKNDRTLSATHFHSTHELATPTHQENQKN